MEVMNGSYEGTFALGVFDFRLGGDSDLFYVNQRKSVPSVSSAFQLNCFKLTLIRVI